MNIKEYWETPDVKSMSDPRITKIESKIISKYINLTDTVLDVGCGDGSGSFLYRDKCLYTGIDRSTTMLDRFNHENKYYSDITTFPNFGKFSVIIFQRCLINLDDKQYDVLTHFSQFTEKIILCEAFEEGLNKVNELRKLIDCSEMKPRWHNKYLTQKKIKESLPNFTMIAEEDLSIYFLLTRVLHAGLENNPNTDSKLNNFAELLQYELPEVKGISTIKVQVWKKF